MDILKTLTNATSITKEKSPMLLVIAGLIGMASTVYMVNEVSPKANDILEDLGEEAKPIEKIKAVAPLYLPAAFTFTASTACIIGSYKINVDRLAKYATAYTLTENKLNEYQKKVIETIGAEKEEEIQKEIVKEHMEKHEDEIRQIENPDISGPMIDGKQWFFDDKSQRFFRCSIADIYAAKEDINVKLQMYPIKLNEFYCLLGMDEVEALDIYEWAEGDELSIRFEPYMCKDGVTSVTAIFYDVPISLDYSYRY